MVVTKRLISPKGPSTVLDGFALGLLSTCLTFSGIFTLLFSQRLAQRPAQDGVLTFHLGYTGDLRLWNKPIQPQDIPSLMKRAQYRSSRIGTLIVRIIPDPDVPWGMTQAMVERLRPPPSQKWTLQLQLP